MKADQNLIRDILLKEKYIQKAEAEKADEFTRNNEGSFTDYFIKQGRLTPDIIGQALSEHFKVDYFDLNTNVPEKNLVLEIPEDIAGRFRLVLVNEDGNSIVVATDDPLNSDDIKAELAKIFPDKKITVCFSLSEDIDSLLLFYKKDLNSRFSQIIKMGDKVASEIVDETINDALELKASDIHFDPQKDEVIVKFRVDGLLHQTGKIPISYYDNILNRIKIQSGLSTVQHSVAQDGAIRYQGNGKSVDLRVSVAPTLDGEKVVIRVLAEQNVSFTMDNLGLSKEHQKLILTAAHKPFGMILVTGPTGSGKTTTLYALLKSLIKPEINISTIEDPVEYKIPGVNHMQINPAKNLTFAEGLKSLVRQDPDIILVGEIRDKETASIATSAALAGHLLFSTFHANDAASVIPRFLEMGLDPVHLSSTLRLVISQRLARKICEKCRYSYKTSSEELSEIFPDAEKFLGKGQLTFYKGKGCPACSNSGYLGRTGIFEIIDMTPELQELMLKNPTARQVWAIEKARGIMPLFQDGLEKVKRGTITIDELLRVADLPEE